MNAQRPEVMAYALTPSLAESLRNETRPLHTQAERSAFMGVLLRGKMARAPYCALLRNLHAIYAELESALMRHAANPALAPLDFQGLQREAALRQDLVVLHGADWAQAHALQPSALAYVVRLQVLGNTKPALLAAHSYVRYLGDLSGGQMLGRIVRDSMRLPRNVGTAFYDFGEPADVGRLTRSYRAGLNAIQVDAATGAEIVAEARRAFEMHCQLFDELASELLSA